MENIVEELLNSNVKCAKTLEREINILKRKKKGTALPCLEISSTS